MAESFINNLNYDLPAPQRKPRVQKYTGGTNSRAVIEARCQRLYSKQLEGKAVSKGQLQTAAQILDSLGKVVGESVETVNIQAPELAIRIEPKT